LYATRKASICSHDRMFAIGAVSAGAPVRLADLASDLGTEPAALESAFLERLRRQTLRSAEEKR